MYPGRGGGVYERRSSAPAAARSGANRSTFHSRRFWLFESDLIMICLSH
jgi:hypothetical protein